MTLKKGSTTALAVHELCSHEEHRNKWRSFAGRSNCTRSSREYRILTQYHHNWPIVQPYSVKKVNCLTFVNESCRRPKSADLATPPGASSTWRIQNLGTYLYIVYVAELICRKRSENCNIPTSKYITKDVNKALTNKKVLLP